VRIHRHAFAPEQQHPNGTPGHEMEQRRTKEPATKAGHFISP
jgi:hypothetical protein